SRVPDSRPLNRTIIGAGNDTDGPVTLGEPREDLDEEPIDLKEDPMEHQEELLPKLKKCSRLPPRPPGQKTLNKANVFDCLRKHKELMNDLSQKQLVEAGASSADSYVQVAKTQIERPLKAQHFECDLITFEELNLTHVQYPQNDPLVVEVCFECDLITFGANQFVPERPSAMRASNVCFSREVISPCGKIKLPSSGKIPHDNTIMETFIVVDTKSCI
uniref:Uncharacterized protein n=1 Tax=Cannabis sativa TaxID=3483 RepID=A0A803QSL6_CANSA